MRLLIVDDNQDAADTLGELLENLGYEVHVAYSGREALAAVRHQPPEVVICDLAMPVRDGLSLCGELCRIPSLRYTRFIAWSGFGDVAMRQTAAAAGFHHFQVKGADLGYLIQLLEEICQGSTASVPSSGELISGH